MMDSTFVQLLVRFLPFLLLMAVWIFYMRRMGGGREFQKRWLDQSEAQFEVNRDIARHLDRIATALEKRT
jgi:ATP-dependent Zn protease